jgi:hypothetical protein
MITQYPLAPAMLLSIAAAGCSPRGYETFGQQVKLLAGRDEIIAVADRLFICTDNRDWQRVRDVFVPEVLFDMTSEAAYGHS